MHADITTPEGRAKLAQVYNDAAKIAEGCARLRDQDAAAVGITPEALERAILAARELRFRVDIRREAARIIAAGEQPTPPPADGDAFDAGHYAACVVDSLRAAAVADTAAQDGERVAADPATPPTLRQQAAVAAQYARQHAQEYRAEAHTFGRGEIPDRYMST
ncbi:hypothetical protein [Streptomyces sp. NBC_01237]|uniref:hypothetical protein n=1 Tax=Streptomyces sp. NBC_01237 TaxID=2903790 RepID=UPI002DDB8A5A|nr:hypothetical protein [Streptomyces sp. NBC_01237]WRZ78731.1 hypothetical protein OG251_44710 [Streptomyces sp. NBC_01237]